MHTPDNKVVPLEVKYLSTNNMELSPRKPQRSRSRLSTIESVTSPTAQENETARWIRQVGKIQKRTCVSFVQPKKAEQNSSDPGCFCGYRRSEHPLQHQQQKSDHWNDSCTKAEPTDAFGEIMFSGFNQRVAKYVRVDHTSKMKPVLDLMTSQWQLEAPDLIISVTGGAKNFHMKPRLKEFFRRGLMKAAETTGAWIVTGGMHAGVMKHVGEAVRDYTMAQGNKSKVVALGMVPWGAVNNKEQLIDPQRKGKWPAEYKANLASQKRTSPLDPNHSHFIMVDNGTQLVFGTEIEFRAKLEREAARLKSETGVFGAGANATIPIVCVVLEGGPGTLKTVKSAIDSGTPAVIVEGSGRAADIIAYAYANSGEEKVEVTDKLERKVQLTVSVVEDEVWEEVRRRIVTSFGKQTENNNLQTLPTLSLAILPLPAFTVSVVEDEVWEEVRRRIVAAFGATHEENNLHMVRDCLKKRDHITVYRQGGGSGAQDIDVAILQALLKVSGDESLDQLKLALAWNQVQIAKTHIFGDECRWQPEELHDVMYEAILNNKPGFVKLFIENGVDLREFLTIKRLLQFYNNVPHKELLYGLLNKAKKHNHTRRSQGLSSRKRLVDLTDVAQLVRELMGDFYNPLYSRHDKYRDALPEDLFNTSGQLLRSETQDNLDGMAVEEAIVSHSFFNIKAKDDDDDDVSIYSRYDREQERQLSEPDFTEPARELFIWNVLMNRREAAMLFWDEGREGIAAALVAQKLLKGMLRLANDSELERELRESLEHCDELAVGVLSECYTSDKAKTHRLLLKEHFEELAVGVLSECYTSDEAKTHRLLVRELPLWGLSTIISLAVEADNKTFIAHAACQTLFTQIWMGKMADENSEFVLWASIFLPPLIPLAVKFRHQDAPSTGMVGTQTNERTQLERETTVYESNNNSLRREQSARHGSTKEAESSARGGSELSGLDKLLAFYMSPVITFRCNLISYIAFLVIFSLVMLTDFHQEPVSPMEYFVIVYVFTLFLEEVRQVWTDDSSSVRNKFRSYFTDPWNILDVVALGLFLIGEVLRWVDDANCFIAARIILAITLMTFCFRVLHIFSVHKELGPKLVMIGQMMRDLMFFVVILLIFIVAYGLAAQVILYPNSKLEIALVSDVLEKAYFNIFGELFLEEIKGEQDCTDDINSNSTLPRCPQEEGTWLVPILMGVYILITNVLMLNLLIAMFSYSFTAIHHNTDKFWSYQRYHLVREYHDRPFIAPPLIVLMHSFLVLSCCCKKCTRHRKKDSNAFRKTFSESEVKQVIIWENLTADEYLRRKETEAQNTLDNKVKTTNDRVDGIAKQVDQIMENSFIMQTQEREASSVHLPPVLEDRLDFLEQQLQRTSDAIDWLIKAMVTDGTKMKARTFPTVLQIRKEAKEKKDQERHQKKERMRETLQHQLQLHQKSRDIAYPTTRGDPHYRCEVPDEKVPWEVEWPNYRPTDFTDEKVLQDSKEFKPFLDPDFEQLVDPRWNALDPGYGGVDRRTFVENATGERLYAVVSGLPRNPRGRTGMTGRGTVFRWGPNHAGDPIVTRWKRDPKTNAILLERNKKKLEFLAVQRTDNGEWAIPGGFRKDSGEGDIHTTLKVEFEEEVLGRTDGGYSQQLAKLWETGKLVYQGYADDPRNTDNAWIETTAYNYHDETGEITRRLRLKAGMGTSAVAWREVSSRQTLYAVHLTLLYKVTQLRDAYF